MSGAAGDLPEGWAEATLGDVVYRLKGKKPSTLLDEPSENTLPYLDIDAFENKNYRRFTHAAGSVVVTEGTPLVVWDGARSGLVGAAPCEGALGSTLVAVSSNLLESKFVKHFLISEFATLNGQTRGTGIPHVDPAIFDCLELPVAPLAEQRRIVAQVEALLARVTAARERLARLPSLLKRFRQSVLAAACSGRLTADWREEHGEEESGEHLVAIVQRRHRSNWDKARTSKVYRPAVGPSANSDIEVPEPWAVASPDELCCSIVDCPHSTPKWSEQGEICLRTTNFKPGFLDLSQLRRVSRTTYAERVVRLEPQENDIVYSREGGILGIACLIPANLKACLGQRMMLFRTHSDACIPAFLTFVLNSPLILSIVREKTGGTSSPHLNVEDIKAFPIPLPPLSEQREIVRRVSALLARADRIEERLAAGTRRAQRIAQSVLAKAFAGELVETEAELARREGRDYEPASALLARIAANQLAEKNGQPAPRRQKPPGVKDTAKKDPAKQAATAVKPASKKPRRAGRQAT